MLFCRGGDWRAQGNRLLRVTQHVQGRWIRALAVWFQNFRLIILVFSRFELGSQRRGWGRQLLTLYSCLLQVSVLMVLPSRDSSLLP